MKNRNYGVALSKIKHHYENMWCGYLTPSEVIALVSIGKIEPEDKNWYSYILTKKQKGISNPNWFYFKISSKILNDLKR